MDWAELRDKVALLSGLPDRMFEKAFDFAISFLQSELALQLGLEEELAKLRRTGERITALLRDAEERRVIVEEHVLQWLRELNNVALDAEDVIGEFETRLPRRGVDCSHRPRTRKRPWYSIATAPSPLILFRRRVATEIKEIHARFDRISKDRKRLRLRESEAPRRVPASTAAPPTAAVFPDEWPEDIGRDGETRELVDLLVRGDESTGTPKNKGLLVVIPIYGMAGLGKTTLAKCVFRDKEVEDRFKANRIWICATKGFDVERMTKEILESLTGVPCNLSNFNLVQCRVREKLMGEPFLLVLDDVREDGLQLWEHLRVCLPSGEGRNRVLITTRTADVARRLGTVQPLCLSGLSYNYCLLLFEQRAFPKGGLDRLRRLKEIGEQIVKKCEGSPLAALSLGGLLHNEEDETEWMSVLNEATEFSQADNSILPKLKLTYEHLPLHLKKCIAFCAVFPDGYLFDKDVLVRLWIAEGFVERRGNRRLEAMGNRFFEELSWRSFFQVSERTEKPKLKYKIPSLFHEVLQSVSRYECFKMVDNEPKPRDASENARHTLLFSSRTGGAPLFTGFHKYKRLRTFSLKGDDRVVICKLPSDLFLKLRRLRVLDLSDSTITELPDSIGELKLLRYLGLCKTLIEWLPESVATLCNLQTLELSDCYKLLKLPEGTSNLVNLRHLGLHLDPHKCSNLAFMPPGIGKLSCLETLSRFIVGSGDGCGVSEIKGLNLRGELWISKLENVVSIKDATEARLQTKQYIDTLTLQWSDCEADRVDVIEHLHPPTHLKNLCVYNYDGSTVPNWLGSGSILGLVNLRLSYCKQWESFAPLGQLPALKELFVEGMHSMRNVEYQPPASDGVCFKVLETLKLCDFPALERWSLKEGVMPHLHELYFSHCPKLIDVPCLPSSLKKLAIKGCPALSKLPPLPILEDLVVEYCAGEVLDMVGKLKFLSSLTISQISSLKNIPKSFFQFLTALKRFEITDCKELISVSGNKEFQGLTSLEYLKISSCPELKFISTDGFPAKLKDLRLCHCYKLTSIPWNLHNLRSLQHLEIRDIPWVMSLPKDTICFSPEKPLPEGAFSSLQYLAISGCPFLEWRCRKDKGIYWSKIKDVFYVEIDYKVLSVKQESEFSSRQNSKQRALVINLLRHRPLKCSLKSLEYSDTSNRARKNTWLQWLGSHCGS